MGLLKVLLLVLFGLLTHVVLKTVYDLGFHRYVIYHAPGPCKVVDGIVHGAEDIHTFRDGNALMTSGFRIQESPTHSGRKGRIFSFDFNHPERPVAEVKMEWKYDPANIIPHGLSVHEEKTGKVTVFIVFHYESSDISTVEVFDYSRPRNVLTHRKSISDERFRQLNDLQATGPDSFYVTTLLYTRYPKTASMYFEILAHMSWCGIQHYSPAGIKEVATGLRLVNGIHESHDGRYIYAVTDHAIRSYVKNKDFSLTPKQVYPLNMQPDNLFVDPESGDLWTAGHPITWMVHKHFDNPMNPAASQVLRFKMSDGEIQRMEEVYVEDGSMRISGSSIAHYYKGGLLVGTMMDKLMYCEVKYLED